MGFFQDFKDFASRGNVLDMAVGVIIGGAFGKIATSLVDGILMPPIGFLLGGKSFSDFKTVLSPAVMNGDKVVTPEVAIKYGEFFQTVIDFLIVAFCIFLIVRFAQNLRKQEEAAPAPPPPQEVLLTEIRDLLKAGK